MALASRARYLCRCRLRCCPQASSRGQRLIFALKLQSFSCGDERVSLLQAALKSQTKCECFEEEVSKMPQYVEIAYGLHEYSLVVNGIQARPSKICEFIWNCSLLRKKLCQLQIEPSFLFFALGNQSRFAYVHQNHFQRCLTILQCFLQNFFLRLCTSKIIELMEESCSVYCACLSNYNDFHYFKLCNEMTEYPPTLEKGQTSIQLAGWTMAFLALKV